MTTPEKRPIPAKRYPTNPITPHGAYYMLHGTKPMMTYRSYDDTIVFNMLGGLAIPDLVNTPECVSVKDLSGLIPPWAPIEQKGATQDGVTFVDALYDPLDCDMTVEIAGKTPQRTARIVADWIAAWDAKKPGELSFFDHYAGRWWAPVRWTRNPVDKLKGGNFTRQTFTWPFKSHDAFWRSYDNTDEFHFTFEDFSDDFEDYDRLIESGDYESISKDYDIAFVGSGDSQMAVHDRREGLMATIFGRGHKEVKWEAGSTVEDRTEIARRKDTTTTTDRQIAFITIGTTPDWSFWDNAFNDIWLRMNNTGTPGTDGIRLRIGAFYIELSYFVGGVKTVIHSRPLRSYPKHGETWGLAAGVGRGAGSDRIYKVLRGTRGVSEVMTVKEKGTDSLMDSSHRKMGFGMESGNSLGIFENRPATVGQFYGGDNATQTQRGMLRRVNVGDQPMWDRYTLFGPGNFYISAGPGSTDMVKFGYLESGQVVQIRTDPRHRAVVDLTSVQPTPQQLTQWQRAMKDLISFASGNNASPLEEEILSRFGVRPPQGNMYSLLEGRFAAPIPAKPAYGPPAVHNILIEVQDGDADTRVLVAGTPLRRWPL